MAAVIPGYTFLKMEITLFWISPLTTATKIVKFTENKKVNNAILL